MATKNIVIEIDDKPVDVILKSARKADGIWRAELMGKAALGQTQDPKSMVGFYLHATCIAAVKEPQWVRDLTVDEFIDRVSEADMDKWVTDAYDLNPQWKQSMRNLSAMGEEEEKKTGTLFSGLTEPMVETVQNPETSQASKN